MGIGTQLNPHLSLMAMLVEILLIRFFRHPVTPAVAQRRIILHHTGFVLQTEIGIDRHIE